MNRLKHADNATIQSALTNRARRQLRLVHIFKNAARVIYKDVQKNPIKLLCFSTFPTTTALGTLGFIGLGLTKTSRDYRHELTSSFNNDIPYKLYLDFMQARFDGTFDVDFKKLQKHMKSQGMCILMQNLLELSGRYNDGWLKKKIQKNLRKYVVKGELTLVS